MIPATLQFIIAMIASTINERMQRKLDYVQEEVRVLKEVVLATTGSARISFTAGQRRRLALAGKELSPQERRKHRQLVTPATLLAWFRSLGARKYDSSAGRKRGRPRKPRDIRKLVIKMAQANLSWGYTKIRDALRTGLKIDPGGEWMKEVARNLTDPIHGFLLGAKYLIHDRDPLFTEAFVAIPRTGGVASVKTPAKSPNCNPHAERFVKTIRYECLNHFVFFGERHLRHVISDFVEHYLGERFHQGIDGQLVKTRAGFANDNGTAGPIVCRSRLGSLLNYYHREAA
jgi:hypothetical protein